jgi:hypothetical protein
MTNTLRLLCALCASAVNAAQTLFTAADAEDAEFTQRKIFILGYYRGMESIVAPRAL